MAPERERPAKARPQPAPSLPPGRSNHAVAARLTRTPAPPKAKPVRPLGASVVDVILEHAPALLPHLPQAWLDAKQARLDAKASNQDVRRRQQDVYDDSRAHYPGLDPMGIGPTRERINRIGGEHVAVPDDVPDPQIDTALLLDADDILAVQPFNRAIHARFRKALHAKLLTQPVTVLLSMDRGPVLVWDGEVMQHTGGRITFKDAIHSGKLMEAYNHDVLRAPELTQLRNGIYLLEHGMNDVREQHAFRIEKDRERPVIAWVNRQLGGADMSQTMAVIADAQAHPEKGTVEQRLEELSAPCPDLDEWDKPMADLIRARDILGEDKFELALWAFAEAERGALRVAQRYERYEDKIQRGGGTAIKWLSRAKMAGTVAAGIVTGGSSLAVQAGAAAGYSLLREGAQQASEMANDLRESFDVGGLMRQATVEGAMAYLGAVTQVKFTEALTARFGARLTALAGPTVAQRALSAGAAATSAFYTAPASRVLSKILAGGELPTSLEQLADMIVEEAIQNAAIDLGVGALMGKAGGVRPHTAPDAPTGTTAPHATVPTSGIGSVHSVLGAEQATPHVYELAGKLAKDDVAVAPKLLDALGPWEDAIWHLRLGTGPVATIDPVVRTTLIRKLVAHREALVAEIGAKFDAHPAGKPSAEPESDLDLNVKGPSAGANAVKIKLYMDAAHPGWERRYRMAVMVDAARTSTVTDALAKLPEAKRAQLARRRAQAAEALQLMRLARGAKTPGERTQLLDRITDPAMREEADALAALDEKGVRAQHDRLIAATDRKLALIDPRTPDAAHVEDALLTQMKANALDPEAYVSPGAIETIVLGHKLTPQKAYEAVLDQLGMIHHQATAAGGMRGALRRYETFKYVKRICDHLGAAGVQDPRLTFLRNHAELVYNVERRATASATPRDLTRADLTGTAHTRDVRVDLGETPGVSDAFLADVHRMLDGVLAERLPGLRALALGEAGPPPVTLPPLGPDVPPGGGGVSEVRRGLISPGALERIGGRAQHPPPAGADLQGQADHFFKGVAFELKRLGVARPKVVVMDLGNPDVAGDFSKETNTLRVNSGCVLPDGKPYYDGSPLGQQRVLTTLIHESRHAEQYSLAARFRRLSQPHPANLARELRIHQDILDAAMEAPLLERETREYAEARRYYEEFFGAKRQATAFGQDTQRQAQLQRDIDRLMTQETELRVALGRIEWWELWKHTKKASTKAELGKVQADLNAYTLELQQRRETYQRLAHEQDARTAEHVGAQVVGDRQLTAASRRHHAMRARLETLGEHTPVDEYQAAIADVRTTLDAYVELLNGVGRNLTVTAAGAKPK